MDVLEAIRTKRAVRLFRDDPVPEETIRTILDAGRRSQSSKNTQPWHFIVIRERERLKALAQAGNFATHLAQAAFAVVLVGEAENLSNSFDLGQAAAYMQLAAWGLGIGSGIVTLHHADQAKALLGVPAEKYVHISLAMGYPSPDFVPNKGGRKPLDEIVHWETW